MGLFLLNIKDYFSQDPDSDLYINNHKSFLDDLSRWAPLCSDAFERASFISGCLDKKVYFLSSSFIDISLYSQDVILRKSDTFLSDIIHPLDLKYLGQVYQELLSSHLTKKNKSECTKYFSRYNLRIKNQAGKWVNLECYSYPIYSINNTVHFCITHVNTTKVNFTPMFQIYFPDINKRYIYQEKEGKFYSSSKIDLKEIEIMILLNTAKGLKEYEIARIMNIDLNKIKYYKKGVLKKLSVNSMPEAIYYALKNRII